MLGCHGHFGNESECAFRPHHKVCDDVKRVGESHEWQDIESCYILDGIFIIDSFNEVFVGKDAVADFLDFCDEIGMRFLKLFAALLISCVEHSAINKHDTKRQEFAVAVGVCATVHSARIVGKNTTHHRTVFGGGVGSKYSAVRLQNFIHSRTYDSRLHCYRTCIGSHLVFFPIFACHNEDGVAHRLSRQRCACRAEGYRQMKF